jgi:hypothetical protein
LTSARTPRERHAVLTWGGLARTAPEVEAFGRAMLYQHDVGLAFLATVGADGAPRVHPACPVLTTGGLYAFVIPSPKQRDLHRDGRYSLHSYPRPDDEDAFFLAGRAQPIDDPGLRHDLGAQFVAERAQFAVPAPAEDHDLFEFHVDRCLVTTTTGHGDPTPLKRVWRAP